MARTTVPAAVFPAPGRPTEIREFPSPALQPGEILLETIASEVCGTDVHLRAGRLSGVPYPIIPGHVSVGRVLETRVAGNGGAGRERATGRPPGEGEVVSFFDVFDACGDCYQCLVTRQENRCPSRRVYGITCSADEGLLGGWAGRILLRPGVRTMALPPELTADDVIGGGCGLFTGFAAVERAGVRLGDSVLVQGVGPVGLAAIAFARASGAGQIFAVGESAERRRLAERLGADRTLGLDGVESAARIEEIRSGTGGRGPDLVIEASGNPRALPEGFAAIRDGGRYVIAGHYTDAGTVPVNPHLDLNRKHVEVVGQWGSRFHHWKRALEVFARYRERMPFAEVIGRRYRLEEADEALDDVESLRVTKAVIVPAA